MKTTALIVSMVLVGYSFGQELEKQKQTKITKQNKVKVDRTIKASAIKSGKFKKTTGVKAVNKLSVKVEAKEEK